MGVFGFPSLSGMLVALFLDRSLNSFTEFWKVSSLKICRVFQESPLGSLREYYRMSCSRCRCSHSMTKDFRWISQKHAAFKDNLYGWNKPISLPQKLLHICTGDVAVYHNVLVVFIVLVFSEI